MARFGKERRQELHERVGFYQEELHQKRLGPSASILAYHFKRSANQEKATRYDRIQSDLRRKTFNRDEAEQYTGDSLVEDDEGHREEKLTAGALAQLPNLFRTLVTTVRSVQLYPPDSKPIQRAYQTAFDAVAAVLELVEHLELSRASGVLLANGHKIDVTDFRLLANSYLELLDRAELESIDFRRGLAPDELNALLTQLGQLKPELDRRRFLEGRSLPTAGSSTSPFVNGAIPRSAAGGWEAAHPPRWRPSSDRRNGASCRAS